MSNAKLRWLLMGACLWTAGFAGAHAAGNDITIVVPEQPDNMEVCNLGVSNIDRILSANVVEALTRLDPADGSIVPMLASSWEQVDDTTWRFHLLEGVKFHDGADFTAAAVVKAVERIMNGKIECQTSKIYFSGINVTAAAVDDHTVDITTDVPTPILPTLLIGLYIGTPNAPEDTPATTPVGTGPYKFDDWVHGEKVTLSIFDGYRGDKPEVQSATYVWRSESAIRSGMVTTGEADLSPYISREDATDPTTDFAYLNAETTRIRVDPAFPPLNDVRVRRALNLAIDRQALKDALFGKDVVIATQLVVPGTFGYNPDIPEWPYDPDEARRLIAEAKADGVSFDTPLVLVGRPNFYPYAAEGLEAMMSMWMDVGFEFQVRNMELADWMAFIQKPVPEDRGPNLVQDQHGNATGDAVVTLRKYFSQARSSPLTDAKLDEMIEQAAVAVGEERRTIIQQVFQYISQDLVADIPMFHMVGYARVSPNLSWRPDLLTNDQIELAKITFND